MYSTNARKSMIAFDLAGLRDFEIGALIADFKQEI
jgi:hypothetical protein